MKAVIIIQDQGISVDYGLMSKIQLIQKLHGLAEFLAGQVVEEARTNTGTDNKITIERYIDRLNVNPNDN